MFSEFCWFIYSIWFETYFLYFFGPAIQFWITVHPQNLFFKVFFLLNKVCINHRFISTTESNSMNLSNLEEAIKVVQVFKATLCAYKIYEQINFTKIYLLVHFLSSMTTNKIALKPQNSLIALSNLPKYLLTPTSDLYYYYIILHYTTTANVIFTIVFFRVFIFRCLKEQVKMV